MVNLQNNFLKLYEEMNQLWESDTNDPNDYKFDVIAKRAVDDGPKVGTEEEAEIDTNYWCQVRELVSGKKTRMGDPQASSWYRRFLTFYKAYKVECAALKWVQGTGWGSSCEFGDKENHHYLLSDIEAKVSGAITPDLNVSGVGIECKSLSTTSPIHGASLVLRHTEVDLDNTEVQACLVGVPKGTKFRCTSAADFFGEAEQERLKNEKLLYIIDPQLRTLTTNFKQLPVKGFTLALDIKTGIEEALENIDRHLNSQQKAIQQRAELILKQQTQELDNVTKAVVTKFKKDFPEANLPSGEIKSDSLIDAAQNLEKTVTKTVASISKKN